MTPKLIPPLTIMTSAHLTFYHYVHKRETFLSIVELNTYPHNLQKYTRSTYIVSISSLLPWCLKEAKFEENCTVNLIKIYPLGFHYNEFVLKILKH